MHTILIIRSAQSAYTQESFPLRGGKLFKDQNGIAGGDVPVVLTVTGTYLHDNGLGDGYTNNIYMSIGTLAVSLTDVRSIIQTTATRSRAGRSTHR